MHGHSTVLHSEIGKRPGCIAVPSCRYGYIIFYYDFNYCKGSGRCYFRITLFLLDFSHFQVFPLSSTKQAFLELLIIEYKM